MDAMKRIAIACVLIGILASFTTARADTPRFCFTHSDVPEITVALAEWGSVSGVMDCGVSDTPDIQLAPLGTPLYDPNFGAQTTAFQDGTCLLVFREDTIHDAHVWLHEIGHCLGLTHSTDPHSVMFPIALQQIMTYGDVGAIRNLYGPHRSFRLFVCSVS